MPLNLASPGILVREVDLTLGRVDPTTDKIGGIVGPFAQGPVGEPTLIANENDLLNAFGQPYDTDKQYETWLTASSYLAYGGQMNVIRADDAGLYNGTVGAAVSVKIKSVEHYEELGYDITPYSSATIVSRNPGSWSNGIKIGIIDGRADQTLTLNTDQVQNFVAVVSNVTGTITGSATTIGIGTTSIAIGQEVVCDVAGVLGAGVTVLGINTTVSGTTGAGGLDFVLLSAASNFSVDVTTTFDFGTQSAVITAPQIGYGITQAVPDNLVVSKTGTTGAGKTEVLTGYFKGLITKVNTGNVEAKFISHVSAAGTETAKDYNSIYKFSKDVAVAIHTNGQSSSYGTTSVTGVADWFDAQQLEISTATVGGINTTNTISWSGLAERPTTSEYAAARGSRFDEVHVVVIDAKGTITGNAGSILEKHLNLSKAKDATFSVGSPSYWRQYLQTNSEYIFGTSAPTGIVTTGFKSGFTLATDTDWDQDAEGIIFDSIGVVNDTLKNGTNYGHISEIKDTGALDSGLDDLISGYTLFENDTAVDVDFLLMGSGKYGEYATRALATKLISVAELRKDAVAFISPHRQAMISDSSDQEAVQVLSDADITDNVIEFFEPVTSSSYAVFDSGYKYMFDRFANSFRYIPLNGDIAGLCARTDINQFPWFSPAGTARGAIQNAVKLAYNPTREQRDRLYSARINPVVFQPGAGIVLFGDKTGFAKASAFDRINVRRLFIFLEDAISAAAKDQLFEFNDEITRTNFVNIVEPFLRDVQAKRGIQDYVVICDETNNTGAIIDANEFVADIYIKPARSINFIGLTFVATRTGVSFDEVIGNV